VAELGVDVLTVPVLRTAFAAFANAHAKASIARAWPVSERGGLLGHPDRAGRLGSLAGELSAASSDTPTTLAGNVHN
jgi:hypothetical protein